MSRSWPRPPLHVVASSAAPLRRTGGSQMSPANAFEGRGRWSGAARHRVGRLAPNTVTFATPMSRDACMDAWARFVRTVTCSRTHCAKAFDITFQTACNWYDGKVVPTGDKMAHAAASWPREFAVIVLGRAA